MKKNILIVDDSDFDRALMTKALSRKGDYNMLEARNRDECMQQLDITPIHLVLMDIMMPGAMGTEVLR